jgi:hypothetical protein
MNEPQGDNLKVLEDFFSSPEELIRLRNDLNNQHNRIRHSNSKSRNINKKKKTRKEIYGRR